MTKILFLFAAVSMLASNIAAANHHEGCKNMKNMDFSMKSMDADKDGLISKDEYATANQTETNEKFKHIDANNDGKLDAKEQKDVEDVLKAIHSPAAKKPTNAITM
jgi:Ca2+-binding EF-hand superfamily protein